MPKPEGSVDAPVEADFCIPLNSDSLHDLASPLNQICSIADLILRRYRHGMDNDAEVLFGLLQSAVERLQSLVSGLRAFARVAGSASAHQFCRTEELLAGALAIVEQTAGPHDAQVTHDPLPELWCNPAQMTYALASLIENSIRFRSDASPRVHVSARATQSDWILSVQDNGIGIDRRHFGRIFSTFRRLNNDAPATAGMGLAITKHVVERHGGSIWVESEPSHGATFYIALPRANLRDAMSGKAVESTAVESTAAGAYEDTVDKLESQAFNSERKP